MPRTGAGIGQRRLTVNQVPAQPLAGGRLAYANRRRGAGWRKSMVDHQAHHLESTDEGQSGILVVVHSASGCSDDWGFGDFQSLKSGPNGPPFSLKQPIEASQLAIMSSRDPPPEPELCVLTSSDDLDDYDVLGMNTLSVAVPYRTAEGFRKLIWAAMVTYVFGNSSVDHVIRRYGHLWEKRKDKSFESDPTLLILRENQEDVALIAKGLEETKTSGSGPICAKSALCRLEATFKAAYGLIRRNYIFESEAVIRMLLEQLAWANEAYSATEEDLRTLNPTKCITPFKALFPEAGKFYGALTGGAHLGSWIIDNYMRFHREGTAVVRRSAVDSRHCGYQLTALTSVYFDVVQKLFAPFESEAADAMDARLRRRHREYCELLGGEEVEP